MKRFACGDVVPGCKAHWEAETEDDILRRVAVHAAADHGLLEIPPTIVAAVRGHIETVSAPS